MAQDKKYTQQDDEIDLVELLGVIIKWRKVIFVFVALVVILGAAVLVLKEYRGSGTQSKIALEESLGTVDRYVVTVKNDPIFASYKFIKKEDRGNKMKNDYKEFLTYILFPAAVNNFEFKIEYVEDTENVKDVTAVENIESSDRSNVSYFFRNQEDYSKFMTRYHPFVNLLKKIKTFRDRMDDKLYFDCINKYLFRESRGSLSSSGDRKLCSSYHYYSKLVAQKFSHSAEIGFNFSYAYMDFIRNFLRNFKVSKVEKVASEDIKTSSYEHFNTKKIVKYSVIVFVLSIIMALFLVFILEFWVKNKERINKYLR